MLSRRTGFTFVRHDIAPDTSPDLAADQHTIIFNLIGYFERRLPRWRD